MMAKLPQSSSQTVGPFFHYALSRPEDNILVNEQTKGQHITLTGRVLDGDGEAIPDAMVEIWQADSEGIFNHPSDPNYKSADPNFRGFGRSDTVREGRYQFETVKPGKSKLDDDTQSSYIRLRVFARGMLVHATTRVYFNDEDNTGDSILAAVPEARRKTLMTQLEAPSTYLFDIHMQGENETVFFDI